MPRCMHRKHGEALDASQHCLEAICRSGCPKLLSLTTAVPAGRCSEAESVARIQITYINSICQMIACPAITQLETMALMKKRREGQGSTSALRMNGDPNISMRNSARKQTAPRPCAAKPHQHLSIPSASSATLNCLRHNSNSRLSTGDVEQVPSFSFWVCKSWNDDSGQLASQKQDN